MSNFDPASFDGPDVIKESLMTFIYRCAHCGAQNEKLMSVKDSREDALNRAYNGQYMPKAVQHPCDDKTVGVAHLIAVRDQ